MIAPAELLPLLSRLSDLIRQLDDEEEAKLTAISQGQHKALDTILATEQALILELRGLERSRISILSGIGQDGVSFREILEQEDEDGRQRLTPLFEELTHNAGKLKNALENSDRMIKVRLHQIQLLSSPEGSSHYDQYG